MLQQGCKKRLILCLQGDVNTHPRGPVAAVDIDSPLLGRQGLFPPFRRISAKVEEETLDLGAESIVFSGYRNRDLSQLRFFPQVEYILYLLCGI